MGKIGKKGDYNVSINRNDKDFTVNPFSPGDSRRCLCANNVYPDQIALTGYV